MTFKSLKKVTKGTAEVSETSMLYRTKKATYGFAYDKNFTTKVKTTDKVMIIAVPIKQKVTAAQMGKYFGKTVAYNAYKAGKYYIRYENWDNGAIIYLGTKKGLNLMYTADPDGDLFIE